LALGEHVTPDSAPLLSPLYPAAVTGWHRRFPGSVEWRLVPEGVQARAATAAARAATARETRASALVNASPGQLELLRAVYARFGDPIRRAALSHRVPAELIAATIATESSGKADSVRTEPGYVSDEATPHRLSVGLMQTLISTAREVLPGRPIDRAWLLVPANSIEAGTAYIARQRQVTQLDPPLVAAAYNAGGVYHESAAANPWRLRCYPRGTGQHVTRFVQHYNAALVVQRETAGARP
jgi:hypothetical protein